MQNFNTSAPYEIIASPAVLYIAPALTTRPDISEHPLLAPSAPWTLIGTDGELNYKETGVRIALPQEVNKWKALGDTGSRKAFRLSEDITIAVDVADLTLEQWAHALNGNTVTDTPAGAAAGHRRIGLSRGPGVNAFAILVRFPSPYGADLWAQLWVPRAINEGSTELTFEKSDPAGLTLEFSAMVHEDAASEQERFGILEAQDAPPAS